MFLDILYIIIYGDYIVVVDIVFFIIILGLVIYVRNMDFFVVLVYLIYISGMYVSWFFVDIYDISISDVCNIIVRIWREKGKIRIRIVDI